jgi:N-acetylneuraminate synthase
MSITSVKIGEKHIGPGQPAYVIAEIGINHNGDVDIAKRLISDKTRWRVQGNRA